MNDKLRKIIINKEIKYIGVLFFLLLLFFWPVFVKGWIIFPDLLKFYKPWSDQIHDLSLRQSYLKSDLLDGFFPIVNIIRNAIRSGHIPLWMDFADLGQPFTNNIVQILFFPSFIFMWVLPVDIGFTIAILFNILLAGLGMYLWLRNLEIRGSLSVIVSVVYIFSGFNSSWLLTSAATINLLTPWVFFVIDRIHDNKNFSKRYWNLIGLSLVLGYLILAGFVAGAGYIIYLSSIYILFLVIGDILKNGKNNWRNLHRTIIPGVLVLIAIIFAIGLTSIFLFPSLDWINFINISYRKVANAGSFLPLRTGIQLFFPNYFGNPVFLNWIGSANWNETSSYFTISLIFMVPIGIISGACRKNIKVIILVLLSTFCILIIWKISPLLSIVRLLPIFDSSSSTRLIGPMTFFLSSLGAIGLEYLFKKKHLRLLFIYFIGIIFLMVIFAIWRLLFIFKLDVSSLTLLDTNIFGFISIIIGLSFILMFTIMLFHWFRGVISEKLFATIIGAILILDILYFSYGQIPIVPRQDFYPKTEITTYLEENIEKGRLLVFDGEFMISGTQLYYGLDTALTHNLHTVREKTLIDLFTEDAWASATAPMLKSGLTDFDSPLFDFFGVKYIVVAPSVKIENDNWILVLDDPTEGRIYKNANYINDKYWFTTNIKNLNNEEDFFQDLKNVADRKVAYIEGSEANNVNVANNAVEINVVEDSSDYNKIEVCTENNGILTVRESFWPGWNATIDGRNADILQTNYIYRGILVDKGCHTIVEEFSPRSYKNGSMISLLAFILILCSSICMIYRNRIRNYYRKIFLRSS